MIEFGFRSARRGARILVSPALAMTLVACGGKVVFIESGAGGATSSSSSLGLGGNVVSSPSSAIFAATATASSLMAETASANTASAASTSTGVTSACDGTNNCNACQSCALGPGAQCNDALMACYDSPPCAMLLKCYQVCSDQSCYDNCYTMNMGGDAYQTLSICVLCQACASDCKSEAGPGCPKGD